MEHENGETSADIKKAFLSLGERSGSSVVLEEVKKAVDGKSELSEESLQILSNQILKEHGIPNVNSIVKAIQKLSEENEGEI